MMSFAQAHLRRSAVQTAIRCTATSSIGATTSSSITSSSMARTMGASSNLLLDSFLFSASTAQTVSSGISALQSTPPSFWKPANKLGAAFGTGTVNVAVSKTQSPLFEVSSHATSLAKVHRELRFALQKKHQRQKDFAAFHARFIPVMREYAHKQWKKYSMDRHDRTVLKKYCNSKMYGTMNTALREFAYGITPLDQKNHQNMEDILKCMTKRTMQSNQFKGTVYRGVRDLPGYIKGQMKPGATFADPAFLSTSTSKEVAYEGAFAGGVQFVIKSKTGFPVARWSSYAEEEVLFPPNTMFMIKTIYPGEGKVEAVITMEEI